MRGFENLEIPLPAPDEQRRIASRLDAATLKVQEVIKLRERRAQAVKALMESSIRNATEGETENIAIGDAMTLIRRPVTPKPNELYQEIGIRSFSKGVFHKEPVTGEDLGDKKVFAIKPGDLLFSNVFAWEGAIALTSEAEEGFIGSHRFMTYRVNEQIADSRYLRHYFTCSPGLDVIRRASPGSAGRNRTLGIKKFESQIIPLPAIETQR